MNFKPHAFPSDGKRVSLGKMSSQEGRAEFPQGKLIPSNPRSCAAVAMAKFLRQDAGLYLTQMAVKTVALTVPLSLMLLHGSHPPNFRDAWV